MELEQLELRRAQRGSREFSETTGIQIGVRCEKTKDGAIREALPKTQCSEEGNRIILHAVGMVESEIMCQTSNGEVWLKNRIMRTLEQLDMSTQRVGSHRKETETLLQFLKNKCS